MKTSTLVLLTAIISLPGCATAVKVNDYYDTPSDALERYRRITILSEQNLVEGAYVELGVATGFSCRRDAKAEMLMENSRTNRIAFDQLKLSAAKLGADFISTPACTVREGIDLSNNCVDSLTCKSNSYVRQPAGLSL